MEHKGKNRYAPDTVFPPGRTLEEALETTGMSRAEFAERMDITTKHVKSIIKDEVPITEDTALGMERVLGVPASFWLNLSHKEQLKQVNNLKNLSVSGLLDSGLEALFLEALRRLRHKGFSVALKKAVVNLNNSRCC